MTIHQGSCHCGRIRFEVDGTIDSGLSCNCSICQRKGSLLWFVPREKLHLLTPDDAASSYTFNKHVINHSFCSTCGIQSFASGKGPGGKDMVMINVRCLDGVDPSQFEMMTYDGRSM